MAKKLINTLTIPIRWMDLDAYGHVGNARLFDFMTDARVDAYAQAEGFNLDIHYVVAEAQCAFKQPTFYPGELILKQYCEKVGRSSFTLGYEFFSANNLEQLSAIGQLTMVCFDPKLKRAIALPDNLREFLS